MESRRTRQLDAVLDAVCEARDHPTAEQIFTRVRMHLPQVSLGTIYRNLEKLVAAGQVHALQVDARGLRFDALTAAHDHFVCELCGSIRDLPPSGGERATADALVAQGCAVRSAMLLIRGVCAACND